MAKNLSTVYVRNYSFLLEVSTTYHSFAVVIIPDGYDLGTFLRQAYSFRKGWQCISYSYDLTHGCSWAAGGQQPVIWYFSPSLEIKSTAYESIVH